MNHLLTIYCVAGREGAPLLCIILPTWQASLQVLEGLSWSERPRPNIRVLHISIPTRLRLERMLSVAYTRGGASGFCYKSSNRLQVCFEPAK